jgi:hypothetical protein
MNPWDRQPGEGARAFEAFEAYRRMGPGRSLRNVARLLHKSAPLMQRWSRLHHWVARVEAWDRYAGKVVVISEARALRSRAKARVRAMSDAEVIKLARSSGKVR